MFKVNNKDTRTTPLAYLIPCSSVSILNFEHVIAGWKYRFHDEHGLYFQETTRNYFSVPYRMVV